jgi:phosphatidylglycerophosphatase A
MIKIKPLPAGLTMRDREVMIATGFGSGRLSPAPGTWGTLAAWVLALIWGPKLMLIALPMAVAGGLWAIRKYQDRSGEHDPGMIVIDEWAGIWVALAFTTTTFEMVLALVLFRILDIWKPWPIRWLDKNVSGAMGVMLDDIAAGLLAGVCVAGYGLWIL